MDDYILAIKTAGDWIKENAEKIVSGPEGCTNISVSFDVPAIIDECPEIEVTKTFYNLKYAKEKWNIDKE